MVHTGNFISAAEKEQPSKSIPGRR